MARPTLYTQELADAICAGLADGFSVRQICSLDSMPGMTSIFKWLRENEEFAKQYAHAREIQAELGADELIQIADDTSNDVTGELNMPNSVAVQRAKLRIDTRKWIAVKLLPKKYGDHGVANAVKESANRLDELVAAMRSGPVERGKVNDQEESMR